MQYHSPLRQSERQEHPDEVQLDQGCQAGIEDEDQQRSKQSQDDDPVGESEPVPEIIELMGHKAILGKHRRQSGEALKGCVGGQDEYRGGHRLHDIEQRAPPKGCVRNLGNHGALGRFLEDNVCQSRQQRDPQKHGNRERTHYGQGRCCIARLRLLEGRYAIGDRFDTCERGSSCSKCSEQKERVERLPAGRLSPALSALGQELRH